jgi:excisionase family DNA binding protein
MNRIVVVTAEELEALVERVVERVVQREVAKLRGEDLPEGVTMAEAARRLHLSTATVQRRVSDGTLPSMKVGGARRVLIDTILPPNGE